jgi:hypothetical protein
MTPSWPSALALFMASLVFFTGLGLPFARALSPRAMPAIAVAPILGWAGFSVLSLPLLSSIGFSTPASRCLALMATGLAAWRWVRHRGAPAARLPLWSLGLALAIGLIPLMAIMPKPVPDGLLLAPPMFDHVKIAVVDAILRSGLPVPNPFYGPGGRGVFAYYYLWHFSAALLARLSGAGGWAAEAAMTGFTASATLLLVMGVARALGGRALALALSVLLCLPGSLRPVLGWLAGSLGSNPFIPRKSDIGGWLNQAAWVPQHLASASCVVVGALLMVCLAEHGGVGLSVALGLLVAAAFESSSWVGGVGLAVSFAALGLWLLWRLPPARRRGFILETLPALLVVGWLIAPFVADEQHLLALRQAGPAVALLPYPTFGKLIPAGLRTALDVPGFWLVMLPFAFPALVPLAALAAIGPSRLKLPSQAQMLATALAVLAAASLATAWLLRSTIENNDLGWRVVLPALLVLPGFAACLAERLLTVRGRMVLPFAAIAALGLPEAATMLAEYRDGVRPGDPAAFVRTVPAWEALRRLSGLDDRVASNPDLAAAATFWPVNPAWALLSDRPACYAGPQSVVAYGAVTRPQLAAIDQRFTRVFSGHTGPGDVADMARIDDCRFALVTSTDGAWNADGFVASADYKPVASGDGWRLYQRSFR